jgi:hypothetical protein
MCDGERDASRRQAGMREATTIGISASLQQQQQNIVKTMQ